MEQVFDQVSQLLETNRSTRQRNLSIRTYKVLPLTSTAGVIEFVQNTMPLHDYLMPAHERYYPKDYKGSQCRKEISDAQKTSVENRVKTYHNVTERFHPVMRYFFTEKFNDPDEWFVKRLAYTRSTAAISILGHVLGLGDRHGHNILLDTESGEVVHIDLGVAFEMGRVLPVPELVPFRLTRDIVDGMGITKTEGVFRRCCEFTLEALRKEAYSIMTILDVLRYDPLYSWSISPVRLAKIQQAQSAAPPASEVGNAREGPKETVNESGEAERALTIVNKKLSKTLSVTATVNDLINQASDERNLAVLYSGKLPFSIKKFCSHMNRLGCICVRNLEIQVARRSMAIQPASKDPVLYSIHTPFTFPVDAFAAKQILSHSPICNYVPKIHRKWFTELARFWTRIRFAGWPRSAMIHDVPDPVPNP